MMALPPDIPKEVSAVLQEFKSDKGDLGDDAFYFVLNHQDKHIVWFSENVSDVLGYRVPHALPAVLLSFFRIISKNDLKTFIRHQKKLKHNFPDWGQKGILPIRVAQDVNVHSPFRGQSRLLIQHQILKADDNTPHWSVGSVMDITHIKVDEELSLAVFDPQGHQLPLERVVGWRNTKLFTEREMEVLQLLSKGYKSKDIEKVLDISLHTVRTHRRNMLKKTKLDNTTQLINFAFKEGIIK